MTTLQLKQLAWIVPISGTKRQNGHNFIVLFL